MNKWMRDGLLGWGASALFVCYVLLLPNKTINNSGSKQFYRIIPLNFIKRKTIKFNIYVVTLFE